MLQACSMSEIKGKSRELRRGRERGDSFHSDPSSCVQWVQQSSDARSSCSSGGSDNGVRRNPGWVMPSQTSTTRQSTPPAPKQGQFISVQDARRQIDILLLSLQPSRASERRRRAVTAKITSILTTTPSVLLYPCGSYPLKTYLPHSDLDLVIVSNSGNPDVDLLAANNALCASILSGAGSSPELCLRNVSLINARTKIVTCVVANVSVDIAANQLGSLAACILLEEADRALDRELGSGATPHLLKKSLILLKAWGFYEAPCYPGVGQTVLGARASGLTSYALSIMVLYLFTDAARRQAPHFRLGSDLRHPLDVLHAFCRVYSCFDWESMCITIGGAVPNGTIGGSPFGSFGARPFEEGITRLRREMAQGVVDGGYGAVGGCSTLFPWRFCNILDPLNDDNNLGYSVSMQSLSALTNALRMGRIHLESLLGLGRPEPMLSAPAPPSQQQQTQRKVENVPMQLMFVPGQGGGYIYHTPKGITQEGNGTTMPLLSAPIPRHHSVAQQMAPPPPSPTLQSLNGGTRSRAGGASSAQWQPPPPALLSAPTPGGPVPDFSTNGGNGAGQHVMMGGMGGMGASENHIHESSNGGSASVVGVPANFAWFTLAMFPQLSILFMSGRGFRADLLDHPCQQWVPVQHANDENCDHGVDMASEDVLASDLDKLWAALRAWKVPNKPAARSRAPERSFTDRMNTAAFSEGARCATSSPIHRRKGGFDTARTYVQPTFNKEEGESRGRLGSGAATVAMTAINRSERLPMANGVRSRDVSASREMKECIPIVNGATLLSVDNVREEELSTSSPVPPPADSVISKEVCLPNVDSHKESEPAAADGVNSLANGVDSIAPSDVVVETKESPIESVDSVVSHSPIPISEKPADIDLTDSTSEAEQDDVPVDVSKDIGESIEERERRTSSDSVDPAADSSIGEDSSEACETEDKSKAGAPHVAPRDGSLTDPSLSSIDETSVMQAPPPVSRIKDRNSPSPCKSNNTEPAPGSPVLHNTGGGVSPLTITAPPTPPPETTLQEKSPLETSSSRPAPAHMHIDIENSDEIDTHMQHPPSIGYRRLCSVCAGGVSPQSVVSRPSSPVVVVSTSDAATSTSPIRQHTVEIGIQCHPAELRAATGRAGKIDSIPKANNARAAVSMCDRATSPMPRRPRPPPPVVTESSSQTDPMPEPVPLPPAPVLPPTPQLVRHSSKSDIAGSRKMSPRVPPTEVKSPSSTVVNDASKEGSGSKKRGRNGLSVSRGRPLVTCDRRRLWGLTFLVIAGGALCCVSGSAFYRQLRQGPSSDKADRDGAGAGGNESLVLPHWVPLGASISIGDASAAAAGAGRKRQRFQWHKDGMLIPGATKSFFSIQATNFSTEGTYSCILVEEDEIGQQKDAVVAREHSLGGTLRGERSRLWAETAIRVSEPPATKSEFTLQRLRGGDMLALHVRASGLPPPEYQWLLNGIQISGATSATYLKANVTLADMGTYTCQVYNVAGTALWEEALVALDNVPTDEENVGRRHRKH